MPSVVEEESFGTVRVFWLDQQGLVEALRREAERVARDDERVVKVVLFGFLAEGRGGARERCGRPGRPMGGR